MSGQRKAQKRAAAQAEKQAGDARMVTQAANEDSARSRQQSERGSSGRPSGARGNRTLLMGMLSDRLKSKVGAA